MSKTYISVTLRREVYERAKECCEYCLIPEFVVFVSHEIDHIIAEKHGGKTSLNNLALFCTVCNKYKGSDLASIDPETEKITPLFHPCQDLWDKHFLLHKAEFVGLTAIGRVTIQLLQLNRHDRVEERQLLQEAGVIKK